MHLVYWNMCLLILSGFPSGAPDDFSRSHSRSIDVLCLFFLFWGSLLIYNSYMSLLLSTWLRIPLLDILIDIWIILISWCLVKFLLVFFIVPVGDVWIQAAGLCLLYWLSLFACFPAFKNFPVLFVLKVYVLEKNYFCHFDRTLEINILHFYA